MSRARRTFGPTRLRTGFARLAALLVLWSSSHVVALRVENAAPWAGTSSFPSRWDAGQGLDTEGAWSAGTCTETGCEVLRSARARQLTEVAPATAPARDPGLRPGQPLLSEIAAGPFSTADAARWSSSSPRAPPA